MPTLCSQYVSAAAEPVLHVRWEPRDDHSILRLGVGTLMHPALPYDVVVDISASPVAKISTGSQSILAGNRRFLRPFQGVRRIAETRIRLSRRASFIAIPPLYQLVVAWMSHRAGVYRPRIRRQGQRDKWLPFGDFNGEGAWLRDVFHQDMEQLDGKSDDGRLHARFERHLPDLGPDMVGASILTGRSGVRSRIRSAGNFFTRTEEHAEEMRAAVLFQLPRRKHVGLMAVHVPHRNSCKGIVDDILMAALRERGFMLKLAAAVPLAAYAEAVRSGHVEKVTLIKYNAVGSDSFSDAAQWQDLQQAEMVLRFSGKRRRDRHKDINDIKPIKKFLDDRSEESRRQILEFNGIRYDDAKVTVTLPNDARRTFYLEREVEGGHPITMALDIKPEDQDELGATSEALSRELRRVLADTTMAP